MPAAADGYRRIDRFDFRSIRIHGTWPIRVLSELGHHRQEEWRTEPAVARERKLAADDYMAKNVQWTDEQRAESAREHERIGYKPGELWPAPPDHLNAEQILDLMRRVPDGAGLPGWFKILATVK